MLIIHCICLFDRCFGSGIWQCWICRVPFFLLGWRGGRQRKVESVRGWMELWMLLRFCGGMERGTPEEGGIDPGLDAVVDAVEAL